MREIDLSDLPEIPPEAFARAIVRKGLQPVERKAQITLRVDSDVLEWFREKRGGVPEPDECRIASLQAGPTQDNLFFDPLVRSRKKAPKSKW